MVAHNPEARHHFGGTESSPSAGTDAAPDAEGRLRRLPAASWRVARDWQTWEMSPPEWMGADYETADSEEYVGLSEEQAVQAAKEAGTTHIRCLDFLPAASPRPGDADVIMIDNAKQPLTRDTSGGASKNRTYDLSIISAAL
jgi:hypothetical protein